MNGNQSAAKTLFTVYFPVSVMDRIAASAAKNFRSRNSEILVAVDQYLRQQSAPQIEHAVLPR